MLGKSLRWLWFLVLFSSFCICPADSTERSVKEIWLVLDMGQVVSISLPSWDLSYIGRHIGRTVFPVGIMVSHDSKRVVPVFWSDESLIVATIDRVSGEAVYQRPGKFDGMPGGGGNLLTIGAGDVPGVLVGKFSSRVRMFEFNSLSCAERMALTVDRAQFDIRTNRWKALGSNRFGQIGGLGIGFPRYSALFRKRSQQKGHKTDDGCSSAADILEIRSILQGYRDSLIARLRKAGFVGRDEEVLFNDQTRIQSGPDLPDAVLYWSEDYILYRHDNRLILLRDKGDGFEVVSRSPLEFGKDDSRLLSPGVVTLIMDDEQASNQKVPPRKTPCPTQKPHPE